jgi:hypothetical protein
MKTVSAAIILAAALISVAIWYGPRERVIAFPNGVYLVKDRWTDEAWTCRADISSLPAKVKCTELE